MENCFLFLLQKLIVLRRNIKIMNLKNSIAFCLLIVCSVTMNAQQKKAGKYIPTKYDSVKKVIPPQVYGDPTEVRRLDSIAQAETIRKEQENKIRLENERKALENSQRNKPKEIPKTKIGSKQTPTPQTKNNTSVNTQIKKPETPKTYNQKETLPIQTNKEVIKSSKKNVSLPEIWSLEECIQFALDKNLQVSEAELNSHFEQLVYEENKANQFPTLNGDAFAGRSFGRNIDPVSNHFVQNSFNYGILDLNSKMLLFGWFQKKYQNEKYKLEIDAANLLNKQLQNDITLNITVGFIRVLMARENIKIAENKIKATRQTLEKSSYHYSNDPYFASHFQTILSDDTLTYIQTLQSEKIALLELKSLMNFNANQKFDIRTSNFENELLRNYTDIPNIENYTQQALEQNYSIEYQKLKLFSAQKEFEISKAMQYPSLSLYGNLGTTYSSNDKKITSQTYYGEAEVGNVNINGTSYPITSSQYDFTFKPQSFPEQFQEHIRAGVALGLHIPIFNGYYTRTAIQKAKLNLVKNKIQLDRQKQKTIQEIQLAFVNAKAASEILIASKNAKNKSESLLKLINQREIASPTEIFEWNQFSKNFFQTQTNEIQAKYQLLFQLKTLDYLAGKPLKI